MRRLSTDSSKAVGYVRVSTDEQSMGAEGQRQAIIEWSKAQKLELVEIYEDVGVSGSVPGVDRPGLGQALALLKAQHVGNLVAVKRDRFARDSHLAEALSRHLARQKIRMRTVDPTQDIEGAAGDLMRTILDGVAGYERSLIRDRTKQAFRVAQRAGLAVGGKPPFGWRIDGKALVPDEGEQVALKLMRELAGQGLTPNAIARELENRGIPCRGGSWHRKTVFRALQRKDIPTG